MRNFAKFLAVLIGILLYAAPASAACQSSDGARYLCGVSNPEDLVAVPGTNWILGSNATFDPAKQGSLVLIDRAKGTVRTLFPGALEIAANKRDYPDCPGPLAAGPFAPQGINLQKVGGEVRLLVVNHRPREAVEVFAVRAGKADLAIAWIGCIALPPGDFANSVAGLPDGGIVATWEVAAEYFGNRAIADPVPIMAHLRAGQVSGHVALWHRGQGWTKIAGSEGSVPNGVEAAVDGSAVWAAMWGDHRIVRFPLKGQEAPAVLPVDYMPDNLRWGSDGRLWSAGQAGTPQGMTDCLMTAGCRLSYSIMRIDAASAKATPIVHPDTLALFDGSSVAMQLGDELWMGSLHGDRIAILPVPK
jgi:hypothetical protein